MNPCWHSHEAHGTKSRRRLVWFFNQQCPNIELLTVLSYCLQTTALSACISFGRLDSGPSVFCHTTWARNSGGADCSRQSSHQLLPLPPFLQALSPLSCALPFISHQKPPSPLPSPPTMQARHVKWELPPLITRDSLAWVSLFRHGS